MNLKNTLTNLSGCNMSEHVLLSIKPEYVEKIISQEKKYEFRKRIWKDPNVKNVTIYSSSPIQRIIGFFSIERILRGTPNAIWGHCREGAGITEKRFFNYFRNSRLGYAIRIGDLKVFENYIMKKSKLYFIFTPIPLVPILSD